MAQPKPLDRVWDIATKLMVPLVLACGTALISHEVRLSRIEHEVGDALEDTHAILQRLDRIVEKLEVIGNRITSLETKAR